MNEDGKYPRESQEAVRFAAVTVNGVPSNDFTYQLTREGERPVGAWLTPIDVSGTPGFMLQPVTTRGTYDVWVRVTTGAQNVVIHAGQVERT
jgi:hypothetical protein